MTDRRVSKWNRICESVEEFQRFEELQYDRLKLYVRRGIPNACRGLAWQHLTGSLQLKLSHPNKFQALLSEPLDEAVSRQIDLDLPRTHYKNIAGERCCSPSHAAMKTVLHAYAVYDKAVGYVQGMAFVVGALLHYMPEEDSFWLLKCLMDRYNYHHALIRDFPFVKLCLSQLSRVFFKFARKLYRRLHPDNSMSAIVPMEFFTSVFVALFSDSLPWEVFTRVWDSFFLEEWKTIFRFVVALLQMSEENLIRLQDDSSLLQSLKISSLCIGKDLDLIMETAFKVRLRSKTLFRACNKYNIDRFEEWLEAYDLPALAEAMKGPNGVEITTHTKLLKTYPNCFAGKQAVDWMMEYISRGGLTRHCVCQQAKQQQSKQQLQQLPPPPECSSLGRIKSPPADHVPPLLPLEVQPPSTSQPRCSSPRTPGSRNRASGGSSHLLIVPLSSGGARGDCSDGEDMGDSTLGEGDGGFGPAGGDLCWCSAELAELGMNTKYYRNHANSLSGVPNQQRVQRRIKSVLILSHMERKHIFTSVDNSNRPFEDVAHAFYRFDVASPLTALNTEAGAGAGAGSASSLSPSVYACASESSPGRPPVPQNANANANLNANLNANANANANANPLLPSASSASASVVVAELNLSGTTSTSTTTITTSASTSASTTSKTLVPIYYF